MSVWSRLDALCEPFPEYALPPLDRDGVTPSSSLQERWQRDGYVILSGLVPDQLIDAYTDAWRGVHEVTDASTLRRWVDPRQAGGWPHATPYMDCPELLALACSGHLHQPLMHLLGEPMGLHLNLTGWVSTRRDWHQDGYLNPDANRDWYAACWIALADIDQRTGPFEYVPGSHRLPTIRQDRMLAAMGEPPGGLDGAWPERSEEILTPLFAELIAEEGLDVRPFVPRKGDVLIWHARLLHRGSIPLRDDWLRPALIAHYSGITHRPDFPAPRPVHGGWYFPIQSRVLV